MTTIERFCTEYDQFNAISEARSGERRRLLTEFEGFAGVSLDQTTDEHLRDFLAKLVNDGLHPNTVRKKRGLILPFYGWAFDRRIVSAETLMRVQRVKNPRGASERSTPRPYDRKEIQRFWLDLDASWPVASDLMKRRWVKGTSKYRRVSTHFMHAQINAVAHLALHAGMRQSEIFFADLNDIHYDNAYVVVRHAARKNSAGVAEPREVPMTVGLSRALQGWLDLRTMLLLSGPKALRHERPWLSLAANQPKNTWLNPMSHDRFEVLLSTVGSGYELHRLRHTCATEWLRKGLELELVMTLLGHSRIQQTLAYAKLVRTDLERGMGRVAADFETAVGRAA